MRRFVLPIGAVALLVLATGPAAAQQPAGCGDFKWPVDRELTAFGAAALPALSAGTAIPNLLGAVALRLTETGESSFEVPPAHKAKHQPSYAGAFPLPPDTAAGSYQVTLSDDAWIDVVQDGKLLKQTGFTGSHTCSVVRKSVRFQLGAGPAVLQISDAAQGSVKVEVSPQ